jgi:hypothetical protein
LYSPSNDARLSAQNGWYPGTETAAIVARLSLNYSQLPVVIVEFQKKEKNKTLCY